MQFFEIGDDPPGGTFFVVASGIQAYLPLKNRLFSQMSAKNSK
jgi:hypothetical protein